MPHLRVRAITLGASKESFASEAEVERLALFFGRLEHDFTSQGIATQTRRLTLPPVSSSHQLNRFVLCSELTGVEKAANQLGIRWANQPFLVDNPDFAPECRLATLEIIRKFPKFFVHWLVSKNGVLFTPVLGEAAQTILDVSKCSNNGFDNFRLGIGSHIQPNTPFFPFSYHQGQNGFSLAVEILDSLISVFEGFTKTDSPALKKEAALETLVPQIRQIDAIARQNASDTLEYKGLDISLAPFPDARRTLGNLYRTMGLDSLGYSGTLGLTAYFTELLRDILKESGAKPCGFNGVMFSVMEDCQLADAAKKRLISLEKLVSWSTVCGCGIDMVPLAGSLLTKEELSSLIFDTATLAIVLDKPLGVRVLPIPNADQNEMTNFNHDFLVNSRVLTLQGGVPLFQESNSWTPRHPK